MKKNLQVCLLVIGVVTWLANPQLVKGQDNNTIYGCYNKQSGALRRVTTPTECTKFETAISWNIVGPTGPQGPIGPPGPPGPSGANRRAALNEWWTPQANIFESGLGFTDVGRLPQFVQSDGSDIWVANFFSGSVSRIRASDGKLIETWTGVSSAIAPLCAMGRVLVTGQNSTLYMIDPRQPAGTAIAVTNSLGYDPEGVAFDGSRIWTANGGGNPGAGSVSIITPGSTVPWAVQNVSAGLLNPAGIVFDGTNIWITDQGDNTLKKLNSSGAVVQAITVGGHPLHPIFDGTNIWVPNFDSSTVTVVRASSGTKVATLGGNGLFKPDVAAFDGERVLITNAAAQSVSLWKVKDLTPLGSVSTGPNTYPYGACSDGTRFWITIPGPDPNNNGKLAHF